MICSAAAGVTRLRRLHCRLEGEEEDIRERKYNIDATSPYTLSDKMQRRISGYPNSLPASVLFHIFDPRSAEGSVKTTIFFYCKSYVLP